MRPGAPQPGLGHSFVAAGPARLSGSRGPLPLLLLSVGFLGGREGVIFPDLLPWPGRGSFMSLHLAPPQLRGALESVAGPSGAAGGTRRVHAGALQSPQAPRSVPGLQPLPGLRPGAGGGGALHVPTVVAGDRLLSHSTSRASPLLVTHQPRAAPDCLLFASPPPGVGEASRSPACSRTGQGGFAQLFLFLFCGKTRPARGEGS